MKTRVSKIDPEQLKDATECVNNIRRTHPKRICPREQAEKIAVELGISWRYLLQLAARDEDLSGLKRVSVSWDCMAGACFFENVVQWMLDEIPLPGEKVMLTCGRCGKDSQLSLILRGRFPG